MGNAVAVINTAAANNPKNLTAPGKEKSHQIRAIMAGNNDALAHTAFLRPQGFGEEE